MPLEASIILLDNSEYAINSDYGNTRWDSQLDATKVVFQAKTNSNPESSVGLMTLAGTGPSVLVSPTSEFGKLAVALDGVKLHGKPDIVTGINVAQLALKHRQNKNQRQRVIVFVGSPLDDVSAAELVKVGKKMKKNNVAVDIVNFGEDAENEDKLRQFVESVNSSDNSHLVTIPAGTVLLSDMILSSAMLAEDGMGPSQAGPSSGAGQASGDDGEFGVDPNLDPELAMALRMSLEEERARQAASSSTAANAMPSISEEVNGSTAQTAAGTSTSTAIPPDLIGSAATGPAQAQPITGPLRPASSQNETVKQEEGDQGMEAEADEDDEDDELAKALALSKGDDVEMGGDDDEEGLTEEEAIARAIAMSMRDQQDGSQK